jgi:hypothetical protein
LVPESGDHKKVAGEAMQSCNFFASYAFHLEDNPVRSQEITMIKSAILASAISLAFIVPAYAQQAVTCDEASLTKMRTDIDAMTDQDKKAQSLTNWEAANAAFKANNIDECTALLGHRSDGVDPTAPAPTTTQ